MVQDLESPSKVPHIRPEGGQVIIDKGVLTVKDVCELMGFSTRTVIRLFENEPGVLILKRPERMHKRRYRCIRIPRAVYQRVANRLTVK